MPSTSTPRANEVLQEIAVVAGEFDDAVARANAALGEHRRNVPLRVFEPASRVRREVGVVAKDLLRRFEEFELHEQAGFAHVGVQRIERFAGTEFVRLGEAVGRRREPEVDERHGKRMAARAAGSGGHDPAFRARAGFP